MIVGALEHRYRAYSDWLAGGPESGAEAALRAARAALSAEGIGDVVLFLASDAARCTCGTLVEINGGKSVS
ncbi:hypothetical protein [Salinifilum ghardaiensis]